MPQMAGPVTRNSHVSLTIMDASGRQATVSVVAYGENEISVGQTDALADAVGNFTNGAVIKISNARDWWDNPADRRTLDETYSSITTKAVFVFQNGQRRTRTFEIPCPDYQYFSADRQTLDRNNNRVQAVANAIRNIIGTNYVFVRGYLSSVTRKTRRITFLAEDPVEPSLTTLPSGEPDATAP